jgi:flavin-dependent dehydrogenase
MSYDAIVIGAGPAGGVSALMLARAGWSVAVVEKAEFPRRKVCGEFMSATNMPLFAELGLAEAIIERSGPDIRRVGLYAQEAVLAAPMPSPAGARGQPGHGWGRALGREVLDTLLLDRAEAAGAVRFQPWSVAERRREGGLHCCTLSRRGETVEIAAPVLIDAHGSWDRGSDGQPAHRRSDMLGFKAHFHNARLAADLMPVLVFPGGYGGLVTSSDGRVCFGCCIRRDVMEQARTAFGGSAADSVLRYVSRDCRGLSTVLEDAHLAGPWLATGPIHPGIRARYADGVFRVGNAAGEAHPLVGEGMSMAMQAAWLLASGLIAADGARVGADLDQVGRVYSSAWRGRFAPRIAAASVFANLAMRRRAVSLLLPLLTRLPALLTYGAARSGKTRMVVG